VTAAAPGAPAIALAGVEVRYDGVTAVEEIRLEVARGELHVLLGESGSGKTTLLRALAGFEGAASGTIALSGRVVDDAAAPERWVPPERRQVGIVFQDYALFPHLDVAGNVGFGMARGGDVAAFLERVGLAGYERRSVSELSGGEQQRVALARTLAQRPQIVLLDEPFSNLNPHLRRELRDETVSLLRREGVTAVLVTHDRHEAFSVADRISVLCAGRLLQTGAARELYDEPESLEVARSVGEVNLLPATAEPGALEAGCALGRVPLRRPASGRQLVLRPEQIRVEADPGAGSPARVERVSYFGAADEVTLALGDGTLVRTACPLGRLAAGDEVRVAAAGPAVCVE
jgi:iron(III) transport system ATP-binding protein